MRISDWSSDVCSSDLSNGDGTLFWLGRGDATAWCRRCRSVHLWLHRRQSRTLAASRTAPRCRGDPARPELSKRLADRGGVRIRIGGSAWLPSGRKYSEMGRAVWRGREGHEGYSWG